MTPQANNRQLTREQVRRVDQLAIERLGIPGVVLMENASRNASNVALEMLASMGRPRGIVAVVCGGGNNGGDGYAMARHLHMAGCAVTVVPAKVIAELTGDAAINAGIVQRMGLPTATALPAGVDLVVDALLGTGFRGAVREPTAGFIRAINAVRGTTRGAARGTLRETGVKVLAVDVPSGLDCDSGEAADPTVMADVTVTFVAEKVGFANPGAKQWLGRVVVADIGAPEMVVEWAERGVG